MNLAVLGSHHTEATSEPDGTPRARRLSVCERNGMSLPDVLES
jgi:hypothetical protein